MTGMVMSAAETAVSATMTMSGMDHSGMDHSGMDHSGMNHGSDANSTAAASGGGGGGHGSMEHVPGTCRISVSITCNIYQAVGYFLTLESFNVAFLLSFRVFKVGRMVNCLCHVGHVAIFTRESVVVPVYCENQHDFFYNCICNRDVFDTFYKLRRCSSVFSS